MKSMIENDKNFTVKRHSVSLNINSRLIRCRFEFSEDLVILNIFFMVTSETYDLKLVMTSCVFGSPICKKTSIVFLNQVMVGVSAKKRSKIGVIIVLSVLIK